MTYLDNYAELIVTQSRSNTQIADIEQNLFRFTVPTTPVIREVSPNRDFALDLTNEYFELHLYNQGTFQLVKSVTVPFSEGYLYIRATEEDDILRLGLTMWPGDPMTEEERAESFVEKYLSDVPFGEYDVFVHLFADELGTYNEDMWEISQISANRKEVILERNPRNDEPFDLTEYKQFAFDSIFARDFDTLIRLLFQKGQEQEEYEVLLRDFYERLEGREPELMENIDQSLFIKGLSILFREIFKEIKRYVQFEIDHNRHRIVKEDFEEALKEIVFEVVSRGIHELPEGRNLFLAE